MTRDEQLKRRDDALRAVKLIVSSSRRHSPPSYKRAVAVLNTQKIKTTWGNDWTPQRLLRFLQRMGYSGLHGVNCEIKTKKIQ